MDQQAGRTGVPGGLPSGAANGPSGAHPAMAQEAPPLRTMRDVWGLITGPEASHWSSLLVQDHIGSDGRRVVFQSCTGSRDTVLCTAKRATLRLRTTANAATLQAAKVALIMRGNLPTKLHLITPNSEQLLSMLGALGAGTTWLDDLVLQCDDVTLSTTVLASIGRCCPNLQALIIGGPPPSLPSPKLFPKLKKLAMGREHTPPSSSELAYPTAGPYLRQLTHLALMSHCPTHPTLPLLFSPGNVGTHLHTLYLNTTLNDTLLGLILQCAPAVEELTVQAVQLQSGVHFHAQHSWRQLQFSSLHLSSLNLMPLRPGMELMCITGWLWRTEHSQPRSLKLSGVLVPAAYQHDALRTALTQLRSWSLDEGSSRPAITLSSWTISPELMLKLPELPPWQALTVDESIRWLPGALSYATFLRLLPDSYCNVRLSCINLTNEQVMGICFGAPVNRTAAAPLHIQLHHCSNELLVAVQNSMQLCPFPNVMVTHG